MDPSTPGTSPSSPPPLQPRRNWWSRNWKWFVPTGCLAVIAMGLAFFALIFAAAFSVMKSSEAYQAAVARAKADPQVQAALGTPIEPGWFVSGHTNVNAASGNADLAIPLSGPKGKGTLYVAATKSAGRWNYQTLAVKLDGSDQQIDLTDPESQP